MSSHSSLLLLPPPVLRSPVKCTSGLIRLLTSAFSAGETWVIVPGVLTHLRVSFLHTNQDLVSAGHIPGSGPRSQRSHSASPCLGLGAAGEESHASLTLCYPGKYCSLRREAASASKIQKQKQKQWVSLLTAVLPGAG